MQRTWSSRSLSSSWPLANIDLRVATAGQANDGLSCEPSLNGNAKANCAAISESRQANRENLGSRNSARASRALLVAGGHKRPQPRRPSKAAAQQLVGSPSTSGSGCSLQADSKTSAGFVCEPVRHCNGQPDWRANDEQPSDSRAPVHAPNRGLNPTATSKLDSIDDTNARDANASASNQFTSACSISVNQRHRKLEQRLSPSNDRHKHSSSSSSSFSSSLLSYIELARSKRSRESANGASSLGSAINNRPDCADRWPCWCLSDECHQAGGVANAITDLSLPLSAANGALRCLAARNNYYLHYNTETALLSRNDAPPSSRGATSTSNEYRQEVDNNNNNNDDGGTTSTPSISETKTTTSATSVYSARSDHSHKLIIAGGHVSWSISASNLRSQSGHRLRGRLGRSRSNSCGNILSQKINCGQHSQAIQHFRANDFYNNLSNRTNSFELGREQQQLAINETKSTILANLLSAKSTPNLSRSISNRSTPDQSPSGVIIDANNQGDNNRHNLANKFNIHQQAQTDAPVNGELKKQSGNSKQQQVSPGNDPSISAEVMAILQQQVTLQDRLELPKTYPNNTLIVDLNECHDNITNLWLQTPKKSAIKSSPLAHFWPLLFGQKSSATCNYQRNDLQRSPKKFKKSRYKFPIPDPIARTNVKLRPDDYNAALNILTGDVRYQLHLLLYRRIQSIWLLLSTILCIITPVVLTNLGSFMVAGACFTWLLLQLTGAFVSMQLRNKLDQMLEKSVAQVNGFFLDHNLMLGVINVGSLITKAKLLIPVVYFDTSQCREHIRSIISIDSKEDTYGKSKHILDYAKIDLPPTKPSSTALAQSQQMAKKIVLRYSQRWISYFDKRKLIFNDDRIGPRHLSTGKCLCQFVEEHFKNRNQEQSRKHNDQRADQSNIVGAFVPNANGVTLSFGGLKNHQQPYNQETIVKSQVIKQQMATRVAPNLSGLVSLDETRPEHMKIDMEVINQHHSLPVNQANSTWSNLWSSQHFMTPKDNFSSCNVSPSICTIANQTPWSSPDVSLKIDSESIGRSDDLVRKLRLLLELRKNDLQGLDGSLFSSILNKTPQTLPVSDGVGYKHSDPDDMTTNTNNIVIPAKESNLKVSDGKKFFNQREGFFFFGSNRAEKEQHHNGTNRSHVLEIC